MSKSDLIAILSDSMNLTSKQSKALVKTVFDEMSNALARSDRIELRGFCSMYVKKYDGYTSRNPRTGEPVNIKPKKLPFFKCGKELKDLVDS